MLDQAFELSPLFAETVVSVGGACVLTGETKTKMAATLNGLRKLCVGGLRSQISLLPRVCGVLLTKNGISVSKWTCFDVNCGLICRF